MSKVCLSIAMGDYDRTRPIVDERIRIDGVDPIFMLLSPEEMFFRAFRQHAFDVSELSISSYCLSVDRQDAHYIALPVFLSRAFRHTSIYIRTDRGILKPQDLAGRKIGIAEYQLSANVWVRGLLEKDFGVKASTIQWIRGGMNAPNRPEKIDLDLPVDIAVEATKPGATLNQMLSDGEIDGFIGPRAPRCFEEGHQHVGRLFADSVSVAADYFRRTGIFPIMHVLGLRRSLADAHPWLPMALVKAFSDAKQMALSALKDTSATKVTMPFVEENLGLAARTMGPDFWSYGIAGNEKAIDEFCELHHRQGLSRRRLTIPEIFHPSTLEGYSL